jgi:hypothetical protein
MPKHEDVRNALDNWARWLTESASFGLGFPRAAPFTRLTPRSHSTEHAQIPVDDVAAMRTHEQVEALRHKSIPMYVALCCRWVGDPGLPARMRRPLGNAEAAEHLGMPLSTYKRHLDQAVGELAAARGFTQ